jgi:hypothetical protein
MSIPARKNSLVVRELGEETLVYDLATHRASCLNQGAAEVFRACNGRRSVAEIATMAGKRLGQKVTAAYVQIALDRLSRSGLVEAAPRIASKRRRETLKRLAAAALVLPAITSVLAPEPAQAQTCLGNMEVCSMSSQCCSGCCGQFSMRCRPNFLPPDFLCAPG